MEAIMTSATFGKFFLVFGLFFCAACGGTDTTPDTSPDVINSVDSFDGSDSNEDITDVQPGVSYSDLHAECEARDLLCPPQEEVSDDELASYATVSAAADALCEDPPDPCEGIYSVKDYRWTVNPPFVVNDGSFYVEPHESNPHCMIHGSHIGFFSSKILLESDVTSSEDRAGATVFHEPGSMSSYNRLGTSPSPWTGVKKTP